jgi:hypothetical protein
MRRSLNVGYRSVARLANMNKHRVDLINSDQIKTEIETDMMIVVLRTIYMAREIISLLSRLTSGTRPFDYFCSDQYNTHRQPVKSLIVDVDPLMQL